MRTCSSCFLWASLILIGPILAQDTVILEVAPTSQTERDVVYMRSIGIEISTSALRDYLEPDQTRDDFSLQVRRLVAGLGAGSVAERDRAFAELLAMGPAVFDALSERPHPSTEVRLRLRNLRRVIARRGSGKPAAVRLLVDLEGARCRDFLFSLLSSSHDAIVHQAVLEALELLGMPDARTCAAELVGMPPSAQAGLLRSWRRLGMAVLRQLDVYLEADDADVRLEAACLYVARGLRKGLPVLVELLLDVDTRRRLVAEDWLKRFTSTALQCHPYAALDLRQKAVATWQTWLEDGGELLIDAALHPELEDGQSLICDFSNHRILLLDKHDRVIWEKPGISGACHVRWLRNGRLLVAAAWERRAFELDLELGEVWSFTPALSDANDMVGCVERMENGHTMVLLSSKSGTSSVLEVNPEGDELRRLDFDDEIDDCDLLDDGRLLIVGERSATVRIVDWLGNEYWSATTSDPREADLLPNGNVLVADGTARRVVELDKDGKVVWQFSSGLVEPHEADRLSNGNTTICDSEGNRILEIDPDGKKVWEYTLLDHPDDIDRRRDTD